VFIWGLIVGLFIGFFLGIVFMCLFTVAGRANKEIEDKQ